MDSQEIKQKKAAKNLGNFEYNLIKHMNSKVTNSYSNQSAVDQLGVDKIALMGIHAELSKIAYVMQLDFSYKILKEGIEIERI